MKKKVVGLGDELREVFSRRKSNYFTGVVKGLSGKSSLLVMFQDRFEKDLNSNQLTVVTSNRISVTEETEVPTIFTKPEEAFNLEEV